MSGGAFLRNYPREGGGKTVSSDTRSPLARQKILLRLLKCLETKRKTCGLSQLLHANTLRTCFKFRDNNIF